MIRFVLAAAIAVWGGAAKAESAIQEVTSPGGITAWLVEEPSIPFVAIEIRIQGGASLDRPGKRGAINLMTGLLEEGSGDLDAREFQAAREGLAASFGYDVGDDLFSLSFQALTENRDEALALFRASIIDPTFDPVAVERVRGQVIAGIESEAQRPNSIAGDRFFADAFPGHPYGSDYSGTIESVSALTRDDLVQAHRDVLVRDAIFVGAVGDITAEELGVVLDELLGDLPMSADAPEGDVAVLQEALGALLAAEAELAQRRSAFDQESAGARATDQAALVSRKADLELAIAAAAAETLSDAERQVLQVQLEALTAQRDVMALTLAEAHPDMQLISGQIEALAARLGAEGDGDVAALQAELAEVTARIEAIPANEMLANTLDREEADIAARLEETQAALAEAIVANRGPADVGFGLPGGVTIVEYPTPQSVALFGHEGMERDDEDFFAAYILNHILGGGGFESRLMQEVREERGLTYGIGTYLVPKEHAAMVLGSVASSNGTIAEAIEVIRAEWQRIASEGVTAEELDAAKTYLTGEYPLRFDGNGPIADIMVGMQVQGLPADYVVNRNDYVNAVTLEDINRVAAELLDAEALHFTVVGQPEGLEASQ